jgi:Glycosyltransferase family 87
LRTASLLNVVQQGRSWTQVSLPEISLAIYALILGFAGCVCMGPLYVEAMRPASGRVNDFFQDWGSARNFLIGVPVYTHHATSIPRHLGIPFDAASGIQYNAHPPTSVLLALPLARLDYPDAVLAWNVISLIAFLISLGIVARVLAVPRSLFLPVLALLTFCHPLYGSLYQGQLTLILVLLVTLTWALDRSGRPNAAGIALGVAAAIKLFPAYLAVYFAARGRLRPLLAAVLSVIALTVVTAAALGLDAYFDYVQLVLPAQTRFRSLGYNFAVAGLWSKLFDPVGEGGRMTPLWFCPALARYGTLLSDLAITAIVAVFAYRARTPAQRDLAFASTVTAMLLVSPVTWDASLPLFLLPIAVAVRHADRLCWMPVALLLIITLLWMPQQLMTRLALGGRSVHVVSWAFMLGVPSLKSYALFGLLALKLMALQTGKENIQRGR